MLETSNTLSSQIADLSIMELCLLIAIKHLSQIYEGEPFNFEMVFHEYLKFKRRKMATLPDERGVVTKAWETLVSLELVKLKGGAGKGAQEQFVLHVPSLATSPDILAAAIENIPNCPTEVRVCGYLGIVSDSRYIVIVSGDAGGFQQPPLLYSLT